MIFKIFKIIFIFCLVLIFFQLYLIQQTGLLKPKTSGVLINTNTDFNINSLELDSKKIEQEINNYRNKNNKEALNNYQPLCSLALERAIEIKTDWSHEGFNKRDTNIYTKYCNFDNIVCTSVGENLAKGQFNNENELIIEWANSFEHNKNMLGDYSVQCVAVNHNHYVSLFAKTIDIKELQNKNSQLLNKLISYDYEKVMYWENQIILNTNYIKNWSDAYQNNLYDKNKIDELIKNLNDKINIANDLWDGVTNQKITIQQQKDLELEYLELSNNASNLSFELTNNAYKKCIKESEEIEKCEIYK